MAIKSYEELVRDIKNKIYHPVYLLQGDEAFYIDKISDLLETSVLDDMEKEFNQTVVYGRDLEAADMVSIAKRYPMMANYQVVLVKEAQDFKALMGRKSDDDDNEKDDEPAEKNPLINYLNNPLKSTVLVFCVKYKTLDKRGKIYKALEKNGIVYESKKIYENKVPEWIEKYLAEKNFKIAPVAAKLMADHLGTDLSKVVNECDKLLINQKPGTTIDVSIIETNIGISKDFNIFELNSALGKKDIIKVTRIVNYFRANPKNNPFVLTIFNFYSYFSKILMYHALVDKSKNNVAVALKVNPFFVDEYINAAKNYPFAKTEQIISTLREYDLKSKGVNNNGTSEGDLLRELVYKILH